MGIILSRDANDFIEHLPLKQARQVVLKIKAIESGEPSTNCKSMKTEGKEKYYRVAVGEYRIIYQWQNEELYIFLIGKRNDDEI